MDRQEHLYAMALTRISNFNFAQALALYREAGNAVGVFEMRKDIRKMFPGCSQRMADALQQWSEPLKRAETELRFCEDHGIEIFTPQDTGYPQRLGECADAPIVLYYKGSADLNRRKVVSIVGTRHCTVYGQDLINAFTRDLKALCPDVLIVSGLAYGVDICAHRAALANGYDTVGVLAHGLDQIYPARHREDARRMVGQGGLLTEFMSMTNADKANFVRRNRIVAGMADATIVVESARKGGALITAGIARSYCREVFAYPGAVTAPYSEGCNNLIRDNAAALITSADDFVKAIRWDDEQIRKEAARKGIERQLFPELDSEEQRVVDALKHTNDLQINVLTVRTGLAVSRLVSVLFQLEMKGVVKPLAGGMYHLIL